VQWNDGRNRPRNGLDMRGANLSQVDLSNLPLACLWAGLTVDEWLRISDKFCQILKEVLPLSALAIQLNYPKTKGKFCRDSQN